MPLKNSLVGNINSETTIDTVATGKVGAIWDIILFNPGGAETTGAKLIFESAGVDIQMWEDPIPSKATIPFKIQHKFAAGVALKIDPGSGQVNYFVTYIEDDT